MTGFNTHTLCSCFSNRPTVGPALRFGIIKEYRLWTQSELGQKADTASTSGMNLQKLLPWAKDI